MAVDPRSSVVWVLRKGTSRVVQVTAGEPATRVVTLDGAAAPSGLEILRSGRILVVDGSATAVFDANGRRVQSMWAGRPARGFYRLLRAYGDEPTYESPEQGRSLSPDEILAEEN